MNLPNSIARHVLTLVALIFRSVADVPKRFANYRDDRRFDNFQLLSGSCLKRKSSRRPTENCRANVAPLRPKGNFHDNDSRLVLGEFRGEKSGILSIDSPRETIYCPRFKCRTPRTPILAHRLATPVIAAHRYAHARTNAIVSATASCVRIHSGIRRAAIHAWRESWPDWRRRTVHLKRDEPE